MNRQTDVTAKLTLMMVGICGTLITIGPVITTKRYWEDFGSLHSEETCHLKSFSEWYEGNGGISVRASETSLTHTSVIEILILICDPSWRQVLLCRQHRKRWQYLNERLLTLKALPTLHRSWDWASWEIVIVYNKHLGSSIWWRGDQVNCSSSTSCR